MYGEAMGQLRTGNGSPGTPGHFIGRGLACNFCRLPRGMYAIFFSKQIRTQTQPDIFMWGAVGLGLSVDGNACYVGVECACLFRQLQDLRKEQFKGNDWIPTHVHRWHQGEAMVMAIRNGWRGCFSEYRLWVALYHHTAMDACSHSATKPLVRSWYCDALLEEVGAVLGSRLVPILELMQSAKFVGAPDLFFWHPSGACRFSEVKSSTDLLRPEQNIILQKLVRIPNIECNVCVTASLRDAPKCRPSEMHDSDSDTP
jgi:hypothetical protein